MYANGVADVRRAVRVRVAGSGQRVVITFVRDVIATVDRIVLAIVTERIQAYHRRHALGNECTLFAGNGFQP